jgi:hypothetical protein
MTRQILGGNMTFPRWIDRNAKSLIKHLLTADITKRYGCMKGGADDVKEHKVRSRCACPVGKYRPLSSIMQGFRMGHRVTWYASLAAIENTFGGLDSVWRPIHRLFETRQWFGGFGWEDLLERRMPAPISPY